MTIAVPLPIQVVKLSNPSVVIAKSSIREDEAKKHGLVWGKDGVIRVSDLLEAYND